MKIKFKKLRNDAIIPVKKSAGAIAFDVAIPEDYKVKRGRQKIDLGFAIQLPVGYEAKIEARSGFSLKGMEGYDYNEFIRPRVNELGIETKAFIAEDPDNFDCDVLTGKVDSDYRGEVGVIIHNHDQRFLLKAGTRIAQMTIYRSDPEWEFEEVEDLDETERGDGGYGHTGTN